MDKINWTAQLSTAKSNIWWTKSGVQNCAKTAISNMVADAKLKPRSHKWICLADNALIWIEEKGIFTNAWLDVFSEMLYCEVNSGITPMTIMVD